MYALSVRFAIRFVKTTFIIYIRFSADSPTSTDYYSSAAHGLPARANNTRVRNNTPISAGPHGYVARTYEQIAERETFFSFVLHVFRIIYFFFYVFVFEIARFAGLKNPGRAAAARTHARFPV